MTTVFIILFIVINLGKGLIALVNKYAPEETTGKKQPPRQTMRPAGNSATEGSDTSSAPLQKVSENTSYTILSPLETAVIVAAVSASTAGQGKVVRIEKI